MSVIVRLRGDAASEKIYIWYNFKQVRDAVLLVLFSEKTHRHEKIFIYETGNGWETEVLQFYVDDTVYNIICERLDHLSNLRQDPSHPEGINIEQAAENYSYFLVDMN